jgi:cytochrome c-type biogenesis protein CcmF
MADLYLSPLEFDPGQPPGGVVEVDLAKGEERSVGDLHLRFVGFDLEKDGNALARMASGQSFTIAARLEATADGRAETIEALYKVAPGGRAEFPPAALPGGGRVALGGIDASQGRARFLVQTAASATTGTPGRLSLDVTTKPLVQLVWIGVYVVMLGGILALVARVRQLKTLDAIAARG